MKIITVDDAIETVWMILTGLGYPKEANPQLEQTVRDVFATVPEFQLQDICYSTSTEPCPYP